MDLFLLIVRGRKCPYSFAGLNPVNAVDLDGLEPVEVGKYPYEVRSAPIRGNDKGAENLWIWVVDEQTGVGQWKLDLSLWLDPVVIEFPATKQGLTLVKGPTSVIQGVTEQASVELYGKTTKEAYRAAKKAGKEIDVSLRGLRRVSKSAGIVGKIVMAVETLVSASTESFGIATARVIGSGLIGLTIEVPPLFVTLSTADAVGAFDDIYKGVGRIIDKGIEWILAKGKDKKGKPIKD